MNFLIKLSSELDKAALKEVSIVLTLLYEQPPAQSLDLDHEKFVNNYYVTKREGGAIDYTITVKSKKEDLK